MLKVEATVNLLRNNGNAFHANTLTLIADTSSNDYKQAKKDLDMFKKALEEEEKNNPEQTAGTPETLTQPTPFPSVTPQISLPAESAAPPTQEPQR